MAKKMKLGGAYAVIGGLFGDEGKGLVTDFICGKADKPLVVRFSGGQQAGHTVYSEQGAHVFSNFGSGTLRGAPTYWSKFCTFDPVGVANEMRKLESMGVQPVLYVDAACPITTPYDKEHNRLTEYRNSHGTCGVGVGSTIDREENHYSLRVGDFASMFVFESKLSQVQEYYGPILAKLRKRGSGNPYKDKTNLPEFFDAVKFVIECGRVIPVRSMHDALVMSECRTLVFEGSQGLMLDPKIGIFPHVTRIPTNTGRVAQLCSGFTSFVVTRAYVTRHGNGPMPNEHLAHNIAPNELETNVYNEYQGSFMRGLLDLNTLKYAIDSDEHIRRSKQRVLVVTCMDHVENEYRFTLDGEIVSCDNGTDFLCRISDYLGFDDVYFSCGPRAEDVHHFKCK